MFYGPSYWRFIHFFALHNVGRDLIKQVVTFLPEEYKGEWEDPLDNEDLITWSLRLHNKVNAKLGKYAGWDTTDFAIAHKPECDFYVNKEFVFLFPWGFIHSVAKTMDPDALDFLKAFNTVYPSASTQGQFFTDEPGDEETVYDWTLRHHRRMNVAYGRPEEMYVPQPPPVGGVATLEAGCANC